MRAVRGALGPVALRRSLSASATAATIFGLRATRAASQRFGLPPVLTTQRITLMGKRGFLPIGFAASGVS